MAFKRRRSNIGSVRKWYAPLVRPKPFKDKQSPPVSYDVTSEPKGTDDQKADHSNNFDWLLKSLGKLELFSCTVDINAQHGSFDNIAENVDVVLGKGDYRTPTTTQESNKSNELLGKDDFRTPNTTLEGNESNAPEYAVDIHVTGWEWICSCLGWGSPHKVGDRTCEGSNDGGGSGGNSRTSSYWTKGSSSYDDEDGSGDSSQPDMSRVDQVLTLSAMVDDISDISLSDSDDDDSHDSKDEG